MRNKNLEYTAHSSLACVYKEHKHRNAICDYGLEMEMSQFRHIVANPQKYRLLQGPFLTSLLIICAAVRGNPRSFPLWEPVIEMFRKRLATSNEISISGCRITLIKATMTNLPWFFLSKFKLVQILEQLFL